MRCGKSEEFYYKADIAWKIIINLAYNDLIFVEKVKLLFFNKYWKIIFAQVIYALTHSLIKKAGAWGGYAPAHNNICQGDKIT